MADPKAVRGHSASKPKKASGKAQLRSHSKFFTGSPEQEQTGDGRYVDVGDLVDADDPIVVGREALFDPA